MINLVMLQLLGYLTEKQWMDAYDNASGVKPEFGGFSYSKEDVVSLIKSVEQCFQSDVILKPKLRKKLGLDEKKGE